MYKLKLPQLQSVSIKIDFFLLHKEKLIYVFLLLLKKTSLWKCGKKKKWKNLSKCNIIYYIWFSKQVYKTITSQMKLLFLMWTILCVWHMNIFWKKNKTSKKLIDTLFFFFINLYPLRISGWHFLKWGLHFYFFTNFEHL